MSSSAQTGHENLREGDLLAFLDGAAPPALARHIAACPLCQAELGALREAEALLATALHRAECPTPEQLLRLQSGLLAPAEAQASAAHVATCADCTAELALLASPPAPTLIQQLALAGKRLVRLALQPAPPPALALRGATPAPRRLVYAADSYQLVLVIAPAHASRGQYQVEGQLLTAAGAEGGAARLSGSAQDERTSPVDELGFFAFDGVSPGAYALDLELSDAQLLAELLEVP